MNKQEKPVVPQFVADWYEEHKDNFEYSIQCLCVHGCLPVRKIQTWFDNEDNKPIETLVMMHKFGYEIKKEKLYTVEIPNPAYPDKRKSVLCKNKNGKVFIKWTSLDDCEFLEEFKLTEEEVKEKFNWTWQFAEEVEECNQER